VVIIWILTGGKLFSLNTKPKPIITRQPLFSTPPHYQPVRTIDPISHLHPSSQSSTNLSSSLYGHNHGSQQVTSTIQGNSGSGSISAGTSLGVNSKRPSYGSVSSLGQMNSNNV
jgi:hypothetical protein